MFILSAAAQQGDHKGVSMEPVVPEELIPPSPVLSVAEALKAFMITPGFVIEPVAAEPLVEKPVCLDFDSRGRMWVCEMRGYMSDIDGKNESIPRGRIVILEDTDADGRVDKRTVFLDTLLLPRSVAVFEEGVLFLDEHRLCWAKRKGDMPTGELEVIDPKFCEGGNVEHKPNGLLANLDNRYYLAKSDKRIRRVSTGWEVESTSFRGQWGIARDDYGRLYHNNNSTLLLGDLLAPNLLQGNTGVIIKSMDVTQLGSNLVWPARVTPAVNRAYVSMAHGFESNTLDPITHKLVNTTASAGMAIYRGTNFPKEWHNTAFTTESVANLVKAIRVNDTNGELNGKHATDKNEFLASTDERFRPVNAYNAPDGSLYILDMYHGIIQHKTYMTSYLRKQILSRGLEKPGFGHGRIYRIRAVSGKTEAVQDMAVINGVDLVKMLEHSNAWQRETAQRLLVERKNPDTIPYLEKLVTTGSVVARIHAIWTLEGMGALSAAPLSIAVRSNDAKLQSSALWATTRLASDELTKIGPILLAVKPAGDEVIPYLVRALGPLGNAAAFSRIAAVLKSDSEKPFVREAAVSGLDHHELAFMDAELRKSKDEQLLEWLHQGAKDLGAAAPITISLVGEDLASWQRGKVMFHGEAACFGCHGKDGAGLTNLGPPLDRSEWVTGSPVVLGKILLHGMSGPVSVAGKIYRPAADMPGLSMNPLITDQNLADIATYIRNAWGNRATPVSQSIIHQQREVNRNRGARAWTAKELAR